MVTTAVDIAALPDALGAVGTFAADVAERGLVADLYVDLGATSRTPTRWRCGSRELLAEHPLPPGVRRITITVAGTSGAVMHHHFTFRPDGAGFAEDRLIRGLHPQIAQRLQLQRLREFDLTRLPSADEEVYLFQAVAREQPGRRAAGRDGPGPRPDAAARRRRPAGRAARGGGRDRPRAWTRSATSRRSGRQNKRFDTNRIMMYVWPPSELTADELNTLVQRILPTTAGAGLEEVLFLGPPARPATGELAEVAVRISFDPGHGARLHVGEPSTEPMRAAGRLPPEGAARGPARRHVYPYELTGLLAGPDGSFTEYDLDDERRARAGRPAEGQEHRGDRGRCGHARRPSGTPKASPGSCCSATRRRRWARCRSRSARG